MMKFTAGVAFLIFKYGPIDWLESNNEYWLEQDAKLRTDFPHYQRISGRVICPASNSSPV